MNIQTFLTALFIAAMYVTWPMLGKYNGVSGGWLTTVVVFGTFLSTAGASFNALRTEPMSKKAVLVLLVVGLVNGYAVYLQGSKSTDPTVPTGIFLVTLYVMMIVLAPTVDWCLNGTLLTYKQGLGVGVALIAIYLLKG